MIESIFSLNFKYMDSVPVETISGLTKNVSESANIADRLENADLLVINTIDLEILKPCDVHILWKAFRDHRPQQWETIDKDQNT